MDAIPSDLTYDLSMIWVTTVFHPSMTVSVFCSIIADNPRNIYCIPSRSQTHIITPAHRDASLCADMTN